MLEVWIWQYEQMVYAQPSILENDTHKLQWDFNIQADHLISTRRPDFVIVHKEENLSNSRFCRPTDRRVKLKESEKRNKYLDLATEKLWTMKVTVIPIAIGALGAFTKGLVKGLEGLAIRGWVETIQTTAWLRSVGILGRVLETWENLLSLKLQWKTIS